MSEVKRTKILIVGSGGNGLSTAVELKRAGHDDFTVLTKHEDFGGCWYQNRYPGCATDTKMITYQLGCAVRSDWQATHATADEMAAYMQDVAREEGIYAHTDFGVELINAEWQESQGAWLVETSGGYYLAQFLLPATGYLDHPIIPPIRGMDSFKGQLFHSSEWPAGYTAEGDRIAIVGTGSSALQIVPEVQKTAKQVIVFQRTPNHILPRNFKRFTADELQAWRDNPALYEQERKEAADYFDSRWTEAFLGQNLESQEEGVEWALRFLEEQVSDPELRARLTPHHAFTCKRPGTSDDYYHALQQPNVELVSEAASEFGENTVSSPTGVTFEVDTVCLATGFLFGGRILEQIKRRNGMTVAAYQQGHHRAYKAVSVAGCPNLFLVGGAGPNGQMWNGLQAGTTVPGYVIKIIEYMEANHIRALEVKESEEIAWKKGADEILLKSAAIAGGCVNYSMDESGHNKAAWPGGIESYEKAFGEFEPDHYISV